MPCELVIELNKANATVIIIPGKVIPAVTGRVDLQGKALPDIPAGKEPDTEQIDWVPALIAAANEVAVLDTYAAEKTSFPRPILQNPSAMVWKLEETIPADGDVPEQIIPAHWEGSIEGFLGGLNTPPTTDGMVRVKVLAYDWINLKFLPAQPTSFSFIGGIPQHVGAII